MPTRHVFSFVVGLKERLSYTRVVPIRTMRILGIETSCDESSVALLEVKDGVSKIVKEMTASQILTHAEFGGVVPEVAARKHAETLPAIVRSFGVSADDVDAVAVTRGPGLITSLRVGTDFARSLAYGWGKPVIDVNHIEGHIAANWIGKRIEGAFEFPAVVLVVSGGHTELIEMKGFGDYRLLGATLDDAAGEAFDKVAKMMELGYPGGPEISARAEKGESGIFELPRPMLAKSGFDFSFSGLKTAVLYTLKGKDNWNDADVNTLCREFEDAVVEVLVTKTVRAAKEVGAKTVFLAGGVSANTKLRATLSSAVKEKLPETSCVLPDLKYTTDNAAMIAMAGYFHVNDVGRDAPKNLEPDPNWELGR